MSVTLRLLFPAGRYHATPWGRHVNEGAIEWPPSPWRLLRALVAVWKRTCPDLDETLVRGLLGKLVAPPSFRLPPHRVAHTRHYMPLNIKSPVESRGGGTTLVLDTFVVLSRRDPLLVHWSGADLTAAERAALERLAGNLASLGRAEAWVEAALTDDVGEYPCMPGPEGDEVRDGVERVPVFCPDPATAFGDEYYPPRPAANEVKKGIHPGRRLFDAPRWHLCLDTETIHDNKWPRVPGARWVTYERPAAPAPTRRAAASRPGRGQPTVARFLLDGPVLPLAVDAVAVADAFRRAAMSRFHWWCRQNEVRDSRFLRPPASDGLPRYSSPILAGKDLDGTMLRSHGHAHYLPTTEGGDSRRLTHVTVIATDGLGPEEVAGLSCVRRIDIRLGKHTLAAQVQLIGLGDAGNFRGVKLFGTSAVWVSETPFVAHRHLKRRGTKRDTPRLEPGLDPRVAFVRLAVEEAARLRELPEAVATAFTPTAGEPAAAYRRSRERGDGHGRACGMMRLKFAEPVSGPVCLGYGSHFGLGLFLPADGPT